MCTVGEETREKEQKMKVWYFTALDKEVKVLQVIENLNFNLEA